MEIPGDKLYRERKLLAGTPKTPRQAPEASIIQPTELLGINNETGTIEVGKRTNLVILFITHC